MDIDQENMQEIRRTNQRGGRCLSVIDLIDANTVSAEAAALCWLLIQRGASFITGAVPGGAGKTTLMASLLAFLPPGEKIVTAHDKTVVEDIKLNPPDYDVCLLAHEIGEGPWFAYIWGNTAADFFGLNIPGCRPVTCLHADTPAQTEDILARCGVSERDIDSIDMHLYIRNFGQTTRQHRVTNIYCRIGEALTPLYSWDETQDELMRSTRKKDIIHHLNDNFSANPARLMNVWGDYEKLISQMHANSTTEFEIVREKVLGAYRSLKW